MSNEADVLAKAISLLRSARDRIEIEVAMSNKQAWIQNMRDLGDEIAEFLKPVE